MAHVLASRTLCWDPSLGIDRDTMVPFNIQPLKYLQQENKTEETGQGQTSQALKQGRAIERINHLLAQRGHFRNGKGHFFLIQRAKEWSDLNCNLLQAWIAHPEAFSTSSNSSNLRLSAVTWSTCLGAYSRLDWQKNLVHKPNALSSQATYGV